MTEAKHQPHIKAKKTGDVTISPIWILPILALIITGWLVVKVVMESKIPITIEMQHAEGIVVGKTVLKFRGINGGLVTDIDMADDLTHVIVHAEVNRNVEPYLTTESKFWVVRAQISLAGVSGLETVLSGDYIALDPSSKGKAISHFRALESAPPTGDDEPGLRVTLQAEKLGSVSEGSQIFYRQIAIGKVRFFRLSKDSKNVHISALIKEQYQHLVNQSTVFWNSGGIRLKGSLSGFEIQTESLSSVLAGGISLFTPDVSAPAIVQSTIFELHEDYDAAGVGVPVNIHFNSGYDLESGITKVKYHGIEVGHLDKVEVKGGIARDRGVNARVIIDPKAEAYLNEDTEFWLVKPILSMSNLSNLETLISGNYINMKVGVSTKPSRDYVSLDGPPPPDFNEPGLHIYLKAETKGSLDVDTPVLYKGVEVGRVANILIDDLTTGVGLHLQIKPGFRQLINSSTKFWNISGVDISAGLGGVKIRSESLMTIIRGGIAFETPQNDAEQVENGHQFPLLNHQDGSESVINFTIRMPNADFLEPGFTKLRYKGLDAGLLKAIHYDNKNDEVIAELGLDPRFKSLLTEGTVFWLVTPKMKASEIKGLDALISGSYFAVRPAGAKIKKNNEDADSPRDTELKNEFVLASSSPALDWKTPGLHLVLQSETAASLKAGSGVYHQDLLVGSVQSVGLDRESGGVSIHVFVEPEYADLVQSHTRFWNVSGLTVNASASGINLNTASLDSLLAGGIAFGAISEISDGIAVQNGEQFSLYSSREKAVQHGFSILLDLAGNTAITKGAAITYKGTKIGEVTKTRLNLDSDSITLTASIHNEMRDLIRDGSRFWLAKTRFGLLRQENLGNLISGPKLHLIPGSGEHKNQFSVLTHTPVIKTRSDGLNLVLESPVLGSVSTGAPIYYRQITVGEVLGFELSKTADTVLIYINVQQRYQPLVRTNSRFWNTSGLNVEAGLLSGVKIKSESLESIIAGGISFATPEEPGVEVEAEHHFTLATKVNKKWKSWRPQIPLN